MESQEQLEGILGSTDEEVDGQAESATRENPIDFAATLSLFKDYLDKKLVVLKEDLKDEAQNTTDLTAKKLKETSEISFKYEGNKQQHKFNRGLADQVSVALKALERKKTSHVLNCLEELEKQINRRNKLIRLADKSPAGWDLVNEYLSDELASGSEDEKRIKKAEQAALRKRTTKQRGRNTRTVNRSLPYTSTSSSTRSNVTQPSQSQFQSIPRANFQRFGLRKAAPTDICFACGLSGHWRVDCRRQPVGKTNQASISRQSNTGDVVGEALRQPYSHVQDPELLRLVEAMSGVVKDSKAKNTQTKYHRGFDRWEKWACNFKGVSVLPACDLYVALFFISLIQSGVSCSIIDEAHYGIKWIHEISGHIDPCTSSVIRTILEAARRLLSVPVKKKEPVTPENMITLFERFGDKAKAKLSDLRLLTLCALGYAGFLRFNELVGLRRCDFQFETSYMRIFIERSKTDVYRDGAWVLIAETHKPTCPVALCKRYFSLAGFAEDCTDYIFRALTYFPSEGKFKFRNLSKLSYTRAREIVLSAFESIGLAKENYGLHSLRAGGASAAANFHVKDRLFKRHGRWKSEKAKDGYIKDDIKSLLSVSKSLGI